MSFSTELKHSIDQIQFAKDAFPYLIGNEKSIELYSCYLGRIISELWYLYGDVKRQEDNNAGSP